VHAVGDRQVMAGRCNLCMPRDATGEGLHAQLLAAERAERDGILAAERAELDGILAAERAASMGTCPMCASSAPYSGPS
jgi:hypothetical protein